MNKITKPKAKNKISKTSSTAVIIVLITGVVTVSVSFLEAAQSKLPMTSVIVASRDIGADTVITSDMVSVDSRYSADLLKQDATACLTSSPEQVVGKRTCVPIYAGETVNKKRLTDNTEAMKNAIGELREISIPMPSEDLGLSLHKGDYIDLYAVPTDDGVKEGLLPNKIANNVEIMTISTSEGMNITDYNPTEINSDSYLAPGYFTVYLDDMEKDALYKMDKKSYSLRIAMHTDNTFYSDSMDAISNKVFNVNDDVVDADPDGGIEDTLADPEN